MNPPFVEVAGESFQRVFCDEIPFYIYAPFMNLPAALDPEPQCVRSSLSFAPTVLHMLSINAYTNFLGSSVFEKTSSAPAALHWAGNSILITGNQLFPRKKDFPQEHQAFFNTMIRTVEAAHAKEKQQTFTE